MSKKKKTPLLDRAMDTARAFKPETSFQEGKLDLPLPELEYIKIPIIGSRTPEELADAFSDLLCWFEGLEYATPEDKQGRLSPARNGINALRDIQVYIKKAIK